MCLWCGRGRFLVCLIPLGNTSIIRQPSGDLIMHKKQEFTFVLLRGCLRYLVRSAPSSPDPDCWGAFTRTSDSSAPWTRESFDLRSHRLPPGTQVCLSGEVCDETHRQILAIATSLRLSSGLDCYGRAPAAVGSGRELWSHAGPLRKRKRFEETKPHGQVWFPPQGFPRWVLPLSSFFPPPADSITFIRKKKNDLSFFFLCEPPWEISCQKMSISWSHI